MYGQCLLDLLSYSDVMACSHCLIELQKTADRLHAYLQAESLKSQPPSLLLNRPDHDAISLQQQGTLPSAIAHATAAALSNAAALALLLKEDTSPHIAASGSMPSAAAQLGVATAGPCGSAQATCKSSSAPSGTQPRMTHSRQPLAQPALLTLVSQPRMLGRTTS